jgi:hypothetical protein
MTQYYFAVFHFGRVNMLSDTDVTCVAIVLALCLKKVKKILRRIKEWYKGGPQDTHENLTTDLMLSEPDD